MDVSKAGNSRRPRSCAKWSSSERYHGSEKPRIEEWNVEGSERLYVPGMARRWPDSCDHQPRQLSRKAMQQAQVTYQAAHHAYCDFKNLHARVDVERDV